MIHEEEDRQIGDAAAHMRFGDEALDWVGRCAEDVERSRSALAAAIGKAHKQGLTLRAIAESARMSHEQVRRVLSR
jgi:hypothetical protein